MKERLILAINRKKAEAYAREDKETTLQIGEEWIKRVNVDIPVWAIKELDREAVRRGITRQSLIKTWLVDCLDKISDRKIV
jgi:hypothetical protein